jgi:hypothetical protein
MSRISILKRSTLAAAAALVFVGLVSPANAAYQHDAVSVFPDLPASATADHADGKDTNSAVARNRSLELTSRLPWLAPVGHRQPHRSEVPQSEDVSAWERQQQQLDQELNRRLIICRGC